MSYVNRTGNEVISTDPVVAGRVAEYHDLVRWGPIISGLLVSLATQLILSAIIGAVAAGTVEGSGAPRSIAPNAAGNAGLWSTIALLISLFTGGWVTARACGPMNRNTALLNGAILWATTLAVSSWLLASGVSGAFGVAASNAGEVINQVQQQGGVNVPRANISAQQARDAAANLRSGLWWFVFGSLLGLIASMIGAVTGARSPRANSYNP
ncbi:MULTISPECIES: hypothetical protein [unclassified Nostoc]|jgi:hypothetical protein|uniref:hypothetical protein n=1 Tax=unclassified Nostoc TaxID=2593658 RepID=UPI000DEC9743|nr:MULTISPECIES: hypothetical protein [unclassified Nostoc]MBD2508435.1 hypothetical protein [Desmonostoc muscorum FACHB-395]QHG17036.1 hypothetical protein GJB62_14345 [Nostoc sp. ATCC 53789]QLE49807.1 hypothetical protein FD724_18055 [Nostoc sp. C057]RCJ15624.1 hypothetical protein A6V25_09290 [Nostoc sp. ATCC 53789]